MQIAQNPSAALASPQVLLTSLGAGKLAQLLASLIEARQKFDLSAADHGRSGVYHALVAIDHYISEIFPHRPDVNHPVRDLLYSLRSLDDGAVAPLLERAETDRRPPIPMPQQVLRANAAVLMELQRLRRVKRELAADTVARRLNQLGYRDGNEEVTGKHVARWRGQARKKAATSDLIATHYHFALQELKARFPNDPGSAYDYYLECVTDMYAPTISKRVPRK